MRDERRRVGRRGSVEDNAKSRPFLRRGLPELIPPHEVAGALARSTRTLMRRIKDGDLEAFSSTAAGS